MNKIGIRRAKTSLIGNGVPIYKNANASLVNNTPPPTIEVLVVAGGGGAGYYDGAGGGAGGVLYASALAVTADVSCTVTVGALGATYPNQSGADGAASNGGNSVFRSGTAIGGGGGGGGSSRVTAGNSGGSGGGGQSGNGGSGTQGNSDGMTGYGNNGGAGSGAGGSGGGAGGAGTGTPPRNGGAGRSYTFDNAMTFAAGGSGNSGTEVAGCSGQNHNLGGGGERDGGRGSNGQVIIKHSDVYRVATVTGPPSIEITGGYVTYYFTVSGTITF